MFKGNLADFCLAVINGDDTYLPDGELNRVVKALVFGNENYAPAGELRSFVCAILFGNIDEIQDDDLKLLAISIIKEDETLPKTKEYKMIARAFIIGKKNRAYDTFF